MEDNTISADIIAHIRKLIQSEEFAKNHRRNPCDFTRGRKLPLHNVALIIMQHSIKSLQLRLHEFYDDDFVNSPHESASPSAFTQARAKLKHTAFMEMGALALKLYHNSGSASMRWRGLTLLGVDSSLFCLPDEDAIWMHFGGNEDAVNGHGSCGVRVPMGRVSVIYDVLNFIALDTRVEGYKTGEVGIAMEQAAKLKYDKTHLYMSDRGFAGYEYFASIRASGAHFLGRCPRRSFGAVAKLFDDDVAGVSVLVKLKASKAARRAKLPRYMTVRFITLRLSTGELEVLATSLLDADTYPTEEFGHLYSIRWNHETYYGVLKGRLHLENFSGRTVEAVLQDVHAAVLVTNLETIISEPVAAEMAREQSATQATPTTQACKNGKKINRAVSFHALKSSMMELMFNSAIPIEETLRAIQRKMRRNPVSVRPDRKVPRTKTTSQRTANYQTRTRKAVY